MRITDNTLRDKEKTSDINFGAATSIDGEKSTTRRAKEEGVTSDVVDLKTQESHNDALHRSFKITVTLEYSRQ